MSIEREKDDLVPSPSEDTGKAERPALPQGSDGLSHSPPNVSGSNGLKTTSSKKGRSENGGGSDEDVPTTQKPKRRTAAKRIATDTELPKDEEHPVIVVKPKRSRPKATSVARGAPASNVVTANPAKEPLPSMPAITNEAIAFLGNPDAKATDLFKLAPASQAFVRYHVTNLQRLEADSALAHTYLLATATKRSARFEKAADALVSKLASERPSLSLEPGTRTESAKSTESQAGNHSSYFGPHQPAVMVSFGKQISGSNNRRRHLPLEENTIEPGTTVEKMPLHESESQATRQNIADAAPSSDTPVSRGGRRFFRRMEAALDRAANWLQDKNKATPVAATVSTSTKMANPAVASTDRSTLVPENVARRFLKVEQDYYFLDRTPAFSDRGNKLATRGEHPEVVRSLVEIAIARGWDDITVKGTESFRRAAWMEASQSGLRVAGYKPTALDLADLATRPFGNTFEKNMVKDRANVEHELNQKHTVTNAEKFSTAQTIQHPNSTQTEGVTDSQHSAKARSFDKDKPSLVVKKHPDLAPAYGVLDAAKKFAEANLSEEFREEFIGLARRHVMNKIISGQAIVGPKVYTTHTKPKEVEDKAMGQSDNRTTVTKLPRTKEIARDK